LNLLIFDFSNLFFNFIDLISFSRGIILYFDYFLLLCEDSSLRAMFRLEFLLLSICLFPPKKLPFLKFFFLHLQNLLLMFNLKSLRIGILPLWPVHAFIAHEKIYILLLEVDFRLIILLTASYFVLFFIFSLSLSKLFFQLSLLKHILRTPVFVFSYSSLWAFILTQETWWKLAEYL